MRHALVSVAVSLLAAGVPVAGQAQEHDARWIAARVRELNQAAPEAWTQIPWVATLSEARQAAKREGRPIFLFTQDGDMSTGRC